MITTQSVDALDQGLRAALAKLPDVIADMRDTAFDRERLIKEVDDAHHEINAMNLSMAEMRADKKAQEQRIGALLAENARLEHALVSIGNAVKQSTQVQDSIAQLAAQTKNGKGQTVIDHEPANEKAA